MKRTDILKLHPKGQLFIDGMLDPEDVALIQAAQDEASFEVVDLDIDTQYCCPACGYEWSGQPKPGTKA